MSTEVEPADSGRTLPDWLAGRRVGEFANVGILACPADAPLEEVAWLMSSNRVHAVLVDGNSDDPPVISDTDLIAAATCGEFDELRAIDVAVTETVSVGIDDSLGHATQLLAEHGVTHLVVRDAGWHPFGILSTLDIAKAISGR